MKNIKIYPNQVRPLQDCYLFLGPIYGVLECMLLNVVVRLFCAIVSFSACHPRPDSLRQVEVKLTLEDHGLVVEYGSRGGGQVSLKKALHLSTGVDHFLIAHRRGDDFTCDGEVMPQDFAGRIRASEGLRETNPCAASVMTEVPYLGKQKRFPDNVATWAVQR